MVYEMLQHWGSSTEKVETKCPLGNGTRFERILVANASELVWCYDLHPCVKQDGSCVQQSKLDKIIKNGLKRPHNAFCPINPRDIREGLSKTDTN